ncbi:MAG: ribosome-associated translation inhibitor RaiA [Alphaproteobacteria bacterium]|nr:ribosome-associated translation inhibitor RaiA [Alphaproteobacteria bacterium]
MTLQITGKNVDAGDAYKSYIVDKIAIVLEKYIGPEISGHVRLEKERSTFRTNCSIRLRTGLLVEAQGTGGDAYSSADDAIEHLEKRVRRYKRRLKDHHHGHQNGVQIPAEQSARDYVLQLTDDERDAEAKNDHHPIIIAETERGIRELTVGEAVMHLDLGESEFLIFRNAGNGGINIVYRRQDGNVGWVDPNAAQTAASGA